MNNFWSSNGLGNMGDGQRSALNIERERVPVPGWPIYAFALKSS